MAAKFDMSGTDIFLRDLENMIPSDENVDGALTAAAVGIARGADIIRVHDVEAMVRVARMTDAIVWRSRDLTNQT